MQIKRVLYLFVFLFTIVTASAQELTVAKMETLSMDTYASVHKRVDNNGTACAVVRVSLPLAGATFSGTNHMGSIERVGADYMVFMPAGSKKMYIQHPNFHELEVNFSSYGIDRLQSLVTYRVTINVPQAASAQKKQTLNIKVTPSDAVVLIDGDMVTGASVTLAVGSHSYNVVANGYIPQSGRIDLREDAPSKLLVELDRKQTATASQANNQTTSQTVTQQQNTASASSGNAKELYDKGLEYYNKKNYTEAVKYFRQAAELGYASSENYMGECYYYGRGVTQDYSQAVTWYRKSAEQGNKFAQYNLGYCYEKGRGVTQDYSQAVTWYRKSADQGYASAQNNLGECYYYGRGVTQDYSQAVTWYRKSADQGYAYAQYNLGYCYEKGQGVTQDYSQAVSWYRKSAEQGNASAQNNLGSCYYNGNGVSQDYSQAVYWYRKSAEQGNAIAQYNLAQRYYYGKGVEIDKQQAKIWYEKSAAQGDEDAKKKLSELTF